MFPVFCQFGNGRDLVEHRWFGRLQRGRQAGHSLAKQLYWPARNLAHEWHHASIRCQFGNDRDLVEHQKLLTDSAINRHCFDRLRIVFPATQPIDPSDNDTFWHVNEYYPANQHRLMVHAHRQVQLRRGCSLRLPKHRLQPRRRTRLRALQRGHAPNGDLVHEQQRFCWRCLRPDSARCLELGRALSAPTRIFSYSLSGIRSAGPVRARSGSIPAKPFSMRVIS